MPPPRPPRDDRAPKLRINERIYAREVRVIDQDGKMLGLMPPRAACDIARARGLDLVEISPTAVPPVCKIIDYGKFLYEEKKKANESKKKQHHQVVKEIKLRPKIDDHDYETKRNHVRRFIEEGDKVKVTIMFRGREIVHNDIGRDILEKMAEELTDVASMDGEPHLEGRNMFVLLVPRPGIKKKEPAPGATPSPSPAPASN